MRKLGVLSILFVAVLDAVVAEAQQPTKIPRIGFLALASLSVISGRVEAFRQGLRELGYVEGKNIVIESLYAEGKSDRLPTLAAELVRLKVEVIVTAGPPATRSAMIMIPLARDSSRQSRAARRKHHGVEHSFPGVERKTTGASEGGRSSALPHGRPRDFDPAGSRTIVKRDRTRGRGIRGAGSVPGGTRSQGCWDLIPSGEQGSC
jgi:hypothetical protein